MYQKLTDLVDSKRLVFITGKGGIGKSVLAASLAHEANRKGKSVLVVQQASADSIGPLFGHRGIGHESREVMPGLSVANFNVNGNLKDFINKHLKIGGLFDSLVHNRLLSTFFGAIPGFGELMFLGRLYYTIKLSPDPPDLVVVDSFASGHFLSLMTTPQAVLSSGFAGPIHSETEKVARFLEDRAACGTIIVGVPEELVVTEMIDLIGQLSVKSPVQVEAVVFNRVLDCKAIALSDDAVTVSREFLREHCRKQEQAWQRWNQLKSESSDLFSQVPVYTTPELGFIDEPLTAETIQHLVTQSYKVNL